MTASPGDGEHAAREGYYPDPSIPGYVRYWNGGAWVPGTSRPAAPADETGPVFLDQTSVTESLPERAAVPVPVPVPVSEPEPEPGRWQVDPAQQAGFGGPRDARVSWGGPAEPEARPGGISLARPAGAGAGAGRVPAPAVVAPAVVAPAAAPVSASVAPVSVVPAAVAPAESIGILSARSPAWPDAPGGGGSRSGLTSAWPEATPPPRRPLLGPAGRPRPGPGADARPGTGPGPGPDARPGLLPVLAPAPGRAAAPPGARPRSGARPAPAPEPAPERTAPPRQARPATPAPAARSEGARAVFERMAERAVRPAGLGRRLLARVLDSVVLAGVTGAAALPLVPRVTDHLQAKVDAARGSGRTTTVWLLDATTAGYLGLLLGVVLLFAVFYEVLPTARWGRTPGKKLLGVRVLSATTLRPPGFGRSLLRWSTYVLLGLPGSLACLLDRPRRRALHDRAAGTYVSR
ncbi:RDD family protein [Streptomyces sp. RerS4]|uniref:RDD family protein n=1 Tax=Streptomyces sp. RerS4 TaxID=2942449 RepID=UPI00201C1952|nr:RDD family protein [Streptomyces sp. RerS4]UQX01356.1 RDD family protein [Streptomyces sp. RerS4]